MARLIKVSAALDFHWHSTPQATLGALGQVINTEGRTGGKRSVRGGDTGTRGQLGGQQIPAVIKPVAFFNTYRGEAVY